jgi:hypothetical protein
MNWKTLFADLQQHVKSITEVNKVLNEDRKTLEQELLSERRAFASAHSRAAVAPPPADVLRIGVEQLVGVSRHFLRKDGHFTFTDTATGVTLQVVPECIQDVTAGVQELRITKVVSIVDRIALVEALSEE